MKLKVIGTGSKGNCYILENGSESLMIECGVHIKEIKKSLHFDLSKLVGCLVTHEHKDHSKSIADLCELGVNVYATAGTFGSFKSNRAKIFDKEEQFYVGGKFKVMAFSIKHDAKDPVGYLIHHPECGKVLFLTDTVYSPVTVDGLNNIIVEANYSQEIIDRKVREGAKPQFLRNRILQSHLSLENCIESVLAGNDLSQVNNIVLIHLSDSNSNEELFKKRVREATGKNVSVASNGMEIEFNKTPF